MNGAPTQTGGPAGDHIAGLRIALRTSRPGADVELLRRAYDVAARCHEGQMRRSGDPYVTHPVEVATILAELGADDQMLCAAILHDTLEYTPCTCAELRRGFGARIAAMVAEHTTLSHIGRRQARPVSQAMAAIRSTDARVVVMRMADRLHNMRTLQFLPQAKQVRKARDVLDIFVPAARELDMGTMGSELQTLAFAALIRNRPARLPCRRAIVALDIERSTSRPDPVKAEFRIMLYELFDAALRSADIYPHRDQFMDRGDGLLALIHQADRELEPLLVNGVAPTLSRFLTSYNAGLLPQRQLRIRMVVHTGEVRYDANGCFGEALDVAFRLLDAPRVKTELTMAPGPLLLVISGDIYRSVMQCGYHGTGQQAFHRLVNADIAGKQHSGWIPHSPNPHSMP